MKGELVQKYLLKYVIGFMVLAIALLVITNGEAGASSLKDRVSNAFNRDKMDAVITSNTCFEVDVLDNLVVKNIGFDYKEYMQKDEKAEFILTTSLKTANSPESQLSSSKISCTSDGNQCNFQSNKVQFDLNGAYISGYNIPMSEVFKGKESIDISIWKAQGLDENHQYDVNIDKLIEQKAYYYLKTFTVYSTAKSCS